MNMTLELIPTRRTYEIIQCLAEGLTHAETADKLGISLSTVDRELRDVRVNEDLQAWIVSEWLSLHSTIKQEDPKECYRALTQLIKKGTDQQINQTNVTAIKITFGNDPVKPVIDVSSNGPKGQAQHAEQDDGTASTQQDQS